MLYRRIRGRDTIHFCTNCSNWPTKVGKYIEYLDKPEGYELCNQCTAKVEKGTCKTIEHLTIPIE